MITIEHLSKTFRVYRNQKARLKTALGLAKQGRDYDLVHSLKDINLSIGEGVVHGLVGMNGAGKSTLLKILTGVLDPTSGSYHLKGRLQALLELGTGFHPEMTGRQNIETNAGLLGFSPREIKAKIKSIYDFSELGDFFDRPVKIYSSGMYVRLAFSFAITVDPQVLIIDEALSVGDAYFQQKCLDEIYRFKNRQTTILFVSHDLQAIKLLCDQVSLMAEGQILFTGSVVDGIERYNALLTTHEDSLKQRLLDLQHSDGAQAIRGVRSGTGEITITQIATRNAKGQDGEAFMAGESIEIEITTEVHADQLQNPTCGILIRDRLGYDVFGTNSCHLRRESGTFKKGDRPKFRFKMDLNLGAGDYSLTVALHSASTHLEHNYDWQDRAVMFKVIATSDFASVGVARLYPTLQIQ